MADKITMSSQATINENGESNLVYYRDDDAIHAGQDSGGTIINFNNGDIDSGITDFASFASKIQSGIPLKKFVADFKEGCNYVVTTSNVIDNLESTNSNDVLSARQGKVLDDYLSLYASTEEGNTEELTFATALQTALTGKNLDNNRSYPIMLEISGENFNGNYTGVITKTSTTTTFLVSCVDKTYSGIFNRTTNVVTNLSKIANQSDIDTINSRLNFSVTATVTANQWLADTFYGGYYQTLTANGVTSSMNLLIDVYHDTQVTAETFAGQCEAFSDYAASGWADAGTNTITLHCYEAPEANFTIIATEK